MPASRRMERTRQWLIAEIILYMNELLKEEHKGIVLATLVHTEIGTKNFGISARKRGSVHDSPGVLWGRDG